jgi:tRNA A-37 threonylcarbamoyl transferase component Bud32/tetratricopeptide (TPR) repeat protein
VDPAFERRCLALFAEVAGLVEPLQLERLRAACGDDAAMFARVNDLLAGDAREHTLDTPFQAAAVLLLGATGALTPAADFGHYRIEAYLGGGGMGEVYRARDQQTDHLVALKVLHPRPAWQIDPDRLVARLRREATILAKLHHPGIARFHGFDVHVEHAGAVNTVVPYLVMELVEGEDLLTAARGRTLAKRLELLVQVGEAVQCGHAVGIVHRDLKPQNILVDRAGRVKVIDFGIAQFDPRMPAPATRVTALPAEIGTPHYMSPEQRLGLTLDVRADVYALGVLLFEIVCDRPPVAHDGVAAVDRAPVPPSRGRRDLPRALDWIALQAVAAEPHRRYADAGQFAADLRRLLSSERVTAAPPSWAYDVRCFLRRRRGVVAAVAAIVIVLAGGLVGTAVFAGRAAAAAEILDATSALVVEQLERHLQRPGPAARHLRQDLLGEILGPLAAAQERLGLSWSGPRAVAALHGIGRLAAADGDLELVLRLHEQGLAAAAAAASGGNEEAHVQAAESGLLASGAAAALGRRTLARQHLDAALASLPAPKSSPASRATVVAARLRGARGRLLCQDGDSAGSLEEHREALVLLRASGTQVAAMDLAAALVQQAVAQRQAGDHDAALAGLVEAERLLPAAAAVEDPVVAPLVADLLQMRAEIEASRGRRDAACTAAESAVALRRHLHELDPEDTVLLAAYGRGLRSLGVVLRDLGGGEAALAVTAPALVVVRDLVRRTDSGAEARELLATLLADHGYLLATAGRRGAVVPLEEALAMVQALHAEEAAEVHEVQRASVALTLAQALRIVGEAAPAHSAATTAHATFARLAARHPDNAERVAQHARAAALLGRMEFECDHLEAALVHLGTAAMAWERLVAERPSNAMYGRSRIFAAMQIGWAAGAANRAVDAVAAFARVVAWCDADLDAEPGHHARLAARSDAYVGMAFYAPDEASRGRWCGFALVDRRREVAAAGGGSAVRMRLVGALEAASGAAWRAGDEVTATNLLAEAACELASMPTTDEVVAASNRIAGARNGLAALATQSLATVMAGSDFATAHGAVSVLALARLDAEAGLTYWQLGERWPDLPPAQWLEFQHHIALQCGHASRDPRCGEPNVMAERALTLLGVVVPAWRAELRALEAGPSETGATTAAEALRRKLVQVRAFEIGFLSLRRTAAWAELFPPGAGDYR